MDDFPNDPALLHATLYELSRLKARQQRISPPTSIDDWRFVDERNQFELPLRIVDKGRPYRRTQTPFPLTIWVLLMILAIGAAITLVSPHVITKTASQALIRINQFDHSQYTNGEQYSIWSPSTCSATAMTEVINAYEVLKPQGHTYRITDILTVESEKQAISPALGLLEPTGIDRTVAPFGYITQWHNGDSLNQIIDLANKGQPVIVSWPPDRWKGGHILVVRGGNEQNVFVADSSHYDFSKMSRTQFLGLWTGFAVIIEPK